MRLAQLLALAAVLALAGYGATIALASDHEGEHHPTTSTTHVCNAWHPCEEPPVTTHPETHPQTTTQPSGPTGCTDGAGHDGQAGNDDCAKTVPLHIDQESLPPATTPNTSTQSSTTTTQETTPEHPVPHKPVVKHGIDQGGPVPPPVPPGELPFTGLPMGWIAALGALMGFGGLALRRITVS